MQITEYNEQITIGVEEIVSQTNITITEVNGKDGAGGIATIVAGTNISVDATDPLNPIVSSSAGGGDMLKSVYDPTNKGYVDFAEGANYAGTAGSAENDSEGNQIVLQYATKSEVSGTITNSHTHSNKSALDLVSGTNTGDQDLSGLQPITDAALETTTTTIVGAINEVNGIAKGAQQADSFANYQDLIESCNVDYIANAGQSVYLEALDIPDLWVTNNVFPEFEPYTFTTDEQFLIDIQNNVQIGYLFFSLLETGKVDLTNYYTKSEADLAFASKSLEHTHDNKSTIDKFAWNSQDSTIEFPLDTNSTLQIGQEEVLRIYNNTGSIITNGQVVYINGSSGTRPTVQLATNATEAGSENTIGVATQDIAINSEGFITLSGLVRGIDTNAFLAGDILYLGATAGTITKTKPNAPAHAVKIGYCVKKAGINDGIILVKVDSGFELGENHDVDLTKSKTTPVDADALLLQDSADSSIWKRLTWSNLKATLDSAYATAANLLLKRDKTEQGDAHGFVTPPNASNFTLSNTGSSVTVGLLANAGNYKINGTDYTNSGLSLTFTASLGQNFVYLTSSGLGQSGNTAWDLLDLTKIPVCTINYDGTNVRLGDELHRSNRNLMEHKKQHDTDGSRYVSGFATTFGSSANNTFSSALGTIRDEERYHDIAAKTNAQLTYRNAALTAMVFDAASTTYAKMNSLVPRYDNAGTLTDIPSGSYGISWMYATNAKLPTNSEIVFVIGQASYTTVALAQASAQPSLAGMSVAEWKLLYRVIYRNVGGALLFTQADDLRLTTTGLAVSGGGATTSIVRDDSLIGSGTSADPLGMDSMFNRARLVGLQYVEDMAVVDSGSLNPVKGFNVLAGNSGTGVFTSNKLVVTSGANTNSGYGFIFIGSQSTTCSRPLSYWKGVSSIVQITAANTNNKLCNTGIGLGIYSNPPTDGVWIEFSGGNIYAKTAKTAVGATTVATLVTGYSLNTFYRCVVDTSNPASINFYVYNSSGTLLGSANATANLPTANIVPFCNMFNSTNATGTLVGEIRLLGATIAPINL